LLITRTLSGLANGAHMAGTEITDLNVTLRDWPQIMPSYLEAGKHIMESGHIALSPPGLPVVYFWLNNLSAALPAVSEPLGMAARGYQCQNFGIMAYSNAQLASSWFGVLMPIWAGLTVFPLYRLGGKWATLWWPLVPSLALFTPVWNTFYPLLTVLAYFALDWALRNWQAPIQRQRVIAILLVLVAGLLTSLLTFANISMVPLIGFLCLYTLFFLLRQHLLKLLTRREMILNGLAIASLLAISVSSVWLLYYFASGGVTPLTLLTSIMGRHLPQDRPYLPWIYLHLYDLALFTGLPVVVVALAQIFNTLKDIPGWRRIFSSSVSIESDTNLKFDPLALSLALILVILALSGTARGETGRVWLFFVPFILILATRALSGLSPIRASTAYMLVTVAQAITLLTVVGFLRVMDTELTLPPTAPPVTQAAVGGLPAPVNFAGNFSLIGEQAIPAGNGLDLTLSWRDDQRVSYPYYFSALIVAPDGTTPLPNVVWQPFDNNFPATCWSPGEIITETRHLPLGDQPVSGNYWISLSALTLGNGTAQGLPVLQPGAKPDTQIGLGPIHIP